MSALMARPLTLNKRRCVKLAQRECLPRKLAAQTLTASKLARAIATLADGDALVVCKLDRLARCTRDLLNTLAAIADAGATFRSLGDPWCDTTSAHGKLMVTVLGGLAEFERHLILGPKASSTTWSKVRAQAKAHHPPTHRSA